MAYKKTLKTAVKKVLRAGKKYARKRYMTKTGGVKVGQVAKDVAMLKRLVNVEKKELQITNGQNPVKVGQMDYQNDGAFALEITPLPVQGDGYNQRNGRSIKYVSANIHYAMKCQSAQQSAVKVVMDVVYTKEDFGTLSNIFGTIWEPDQFSGFRDCNAQRNPNYFADYKIIRSVTRWIPAQKISGKASAVTGRFGLKLNNHIRFLDNSVSPPIPTGNRYFLIVRTDRGNCNTTTTGTAAGFVPDLAPNTGIEFHYDIANYYTDN